MHKSALILVFLTFSLYLNGFTKLIYLAPNGNDRNNGTLNQPFATLQRAQIEARKYKNEPVSFLLKGGTYYLKQALILAKEDSRTRSNPLTITVYRNEKVYIKGSEKLNLNWKAKDNIQTATVSNPDLIFDQLYVNGALMQMARYPNYTKGKLPFGGTAEDAISPQRIQSWKNPGGGYLHVMQSHMWGGFAYQITGKSGTELKMEGGWQNNRPSAMHKQYRFVEHIIEELDTLNEWYFDKVNRKILLKTNVNLQHALIEVPQLETLIEIKGTSVMPVKNITIKGISFSHTLRTFMKNKEPLLRSDWTICRKGALTIEGAENVLIENCVFNETGGNVIFYSNYNKFNTVRGNHIYNSGGSGISFVGDPNAVRSPSFHYDQFVAFEKLDKQQGPIGHNYPVQCTVYDNLIHDIGQVEKQTAGVQISMSEEIKVSHNTIYDVPRAGININEGTWGGHIIANNDVFNTVMETGDHGAFNSWGRDRYWHPKRATMDTLVAMHSSLILLDAYKTTMIINNRFRCDHGWDIDLDDGSSNYIIKDNVCLNGGLKLREGFKRTVENNIIINNSFHPHVWFKNSGDVFKHNVVGAAYFPIQINDWGKQIDSNFLPDPASLQKVQQWGNDKNSIAGNPQFIDVNKGDYRLKPGSKTFNIGFKNFEMKFGVLSPKLIAKAKKVPLPKIQVLDLKEDAIYEFSGVKVKRLSTLAERSATGMPTETGVLVLSIDQNSPMINSLKPNDVILQMAGQPIKTLNDLVNARQKSQSKKTADLKIFRDQKESSITVNLK